MTDRTIVVDAPLVEPAPSEYRRRQIDYWRGLARENLLLGYADLARRCEGFASGWEFGLEALEAAP